MALELPKFTKKEKAPGSGGKKSDLSLKVFEFLDKNPAMKIVIPVLLFLILVIIFLFAIFGDGILIGDENAGLEDIDASQNQVEVIPGNDIIKDKELVSLINEDPLSPDIMATAEYTGMVSGSSGLKTVLIEIGSSGDSLVLTLGETIGDSDWELIEITGDYVVFKAGETTKKLTLK